MFSVKLVLRFRELCVWVWRLLAIHLLWTFTVVLGLGVFTLGPATVAMFSVIRQWLMGNESIKIVKSYVSYVKENFLKNTGMGIVSLLMGAILYTDIYFNKNFYTLVFFLVIGLVYLGVMFFLYPIAAHFTWRNTWERMRFALLYFFSFFPYATFGIIAVIAYFVAVFYIFPIMFPMFGFAIPTLIIMFISMKAFKKAELRNEVEWKLEHQHGVEVK
ncbi:YesL family protein [Fredinandcohnia onubensis]|uniref:YesL family protein n=1 Tax=Fredinandcohnia onubensis TaxID=1571209 RepID=UPI000C0BBD77|nr:DUF624 domain-containing protein [Fredinandcohnia onubensis]